MKFALILYLFSLCGFTNTLEITSEEILVHGDSVNIVARFSKSYAEDEIEKVIEENKNKLGPFYLLKIGFIKQEDNKTTVGFNGFYDSPKDIHNSTMKIGNENLVFDIVNREKLDPAELKLDTKFSYFFREFNTPNELNYLYICISLVLLFVIVMLIRTFLIRRKIKKAEIEYRENWVRAFKACYKRTDYERIFKEKEKWLPLVGGDAKRFIKTINKYQYKKEWSQIEIAQVTNEFNKLREKISTNGI